MIWVQISSAIWANFIACFIKFGEKVSQITTVAIFCLNTLKTKMFNIARSADLIAYNYGKTPQT